MVVLRNATSADGDFLFLVYRETNIGMFESLGPDMCEILLKQQSEFQESHYDTRYPQ